MSYAITSSEVNTPRIASFSACSSLVSNLLIAKSGLDINQADFRAFDIQSNIRARITQLIMAK